MLQVKGDSAAAPKESSQEAYDEDLQNLGMGYVPIILSIKCLLD